ncbi:MAG TPA: 3-oxoacyl-[acyl-carrier-protein] synthase III C-terminal domain-containing protein [Polyangiaceae bacterium]
MSAIFNCMMESEQSKNVNARAGLTGVTEIVATGYHYPSDVVTNDDFFARARYRVCKDEESRAALIRDSRMKTRRWCANGENTWTMAQSAIAMAFESSPVDKSEIDVVIVSSCSTIPMVNYPDPKNPVQADLAPRVLAALGREDALGFDVKAMYCAGTLRGMELMDRLLQNPNYRAGLLVGTDQGGFAATAESNRSAFCFLVGDSAGAMVMKRRDVAPGERVGLVDYLGGLRPTQADLSSWGPDGKSMVVLPGAGPVAIEYLVSCARKLLDRNGLTPKDVSWMLPMQTHTQIVEAVCTQLDWPAEKVVWTGDVTGYSASASIPTCFGAHVHNGKIRKGDLVLSMAVGSGFNWAGALYYY